MGKALSVAAALALTLAAGCASGRHESSSEGDVVALNLGMEHIGDLLKLHHSLVAAGIPSNLGVIDLNYEPILVSAPEAPRARTAAAEIVVRDLLTVRLLKSPVPWESPSLFTNPVFEVWERGRLVREEGFKLY